MLLENLIPHRILSEVVEHVVDIVVLLLDEILFDWFNAHHIPVVLLQHHVDLNILEEGGNLNIVSWEKKFWKKKKK